MHRLLFITDVHLGRKPKSRGGDYHADIINKLNRVVDFANRKEVEFLLLGGDLLDIPIVAPFITLDLANTLSRFSGKIVSAIGEHDTHGHSIDQFSNTSLALLRRMLGPDKLLLADRSDGEMSGFTALDHKVKRTYIGIHVIHCWHKPQTREILANIPDGDIVIAHSLITPHELPYECVPLNTITTKASIVFSGDFHSRFSVKQNETRFVNPGPFSRRKRTDPDPMAVYCEYTKNKVTKMKMIPITCDPLEWHSVPQASETHEPSISEFAQKVQSYKRTASDIYSLVEQVADSEKVDHEVVSLIRSLREHNASN